MRMTLRGRAVALLALIALAGCALDREQVLRAELARHLYLGATLHFVSRPVCTAGVFEVELASFRQNASRAQSMRQAVELIGQGRPVIFADPALSPDDVTEALMTTDLPAGLGVLASGLAPLTDCMQQDGIAEGFYRVLTAPETRMMYDPQRHSLLLLYPPERLALYMRRSDW